MDIALPVLSILLRTEFCAIGGCSEDAFADESCGAPLQVNARPPPLFLQIRPRAADILVLISHNLPPRRTHVDAFDRTRPAARDASQQQIEYCPRCCTSGRAGRLLDLSRRSFRPATSCSGNRPVSASCRARRSVRGAGASGRGHTDFCSGRHHRGLIPPPSESRARCADAGFRPFNGAKALAKWASISRQCERLLVWAIGDASRPASLVQPGKVSCHMTHASPGG